MGFVGSLSEIRGKRRRAKLISPAVAAVPTISKVTFEGDSITSDGDTFTKGYAKWWIDNNPGVTCTNRAATSAVIGGSGDAGGTNSLWGRKATVIADAPELLHILIGANDVVNYDTVNGSGPASTDWLTNLYAYIAYMRANIPSLKYVVVGGITPTDPTKLPNPTTGGAAVNARRNTINPLLRAAVGNQIDAYTPFGDYWDDNAFFDDYVSGDGVHPYTDGRKIMQRIIAAVLDPIIAKKTASSPDAFTFIDQTNVTLSGTATGQVYLTGMGIGKTVSVSQTGGQLARGAASFGSGPTNMMNGDALNAKATVSGSNGVATNVVVSAGATSDTFTATSAVSSPVAFTSSSDARTAGDLAYDPVSDTFNAVTFPAGRPIVMVQKPYESPTGVTINGVAASEVGGAGASFNSIFSLWIGPPGQNLTAGTYAVVVSGVAYHNPACAIYPGAVQGCSTVAGAMQVRKVPWVYQIGGTITPSTALQMASGSQALIASLMDDSCTYTAWNGSVERAYSTNSNEGYPVRPRFATSRVSGGIGYRSNGGQSGAIVVELAP